MRKWAFGLGLVVVVLITTSGAFLWMYRFDLIVWQVTRLLEKRGLGPAAFAIDDLGLAGFHAHDISLGNGAIKAGELTVSYTTDELLIGHLDRVEIGQFNATLAMGKNGILLNGQPITTGASGPLPITGFRIDALAFRDARLTLATASSPVEVTASGMLALADEEVRGTNVTATISAPVGGVRRRTRIAAEVLVINAKAQGGVQLTIQQAAVTPEGLAWFAQAIDGKIVWQSDQTTAQLSVGRLINRLQPALVAPLSLVASVTLVGSQLDFALKGEIGSKGLAKLQAKGRHDIVSSSGSATLGLGPVLFHPGVLQPVQLFPTFFGVAEDVDGSVTLAGGLRWTAETMTPDLTLKLKDLAFSESGVQVRALKGEIKLNKLWPLTTPPGQTLTAVIEAAGFPPANVTLVGQLAAKPALKLDRVAVDTAGGEIVASPFTIDPALPEIVTTLRVDHVDLAEITKLLSIDGLTGTGQLDGAIPIVLDGGKVAISGGKLIARAPGVLGYKPSNLPPEIAGAGETVAMALQALSDFHYDRLRLDLDKSSSGDGTVLLHMEGRNPAFMSGQVFNFNIRVDSNFDRLAGYVLLGLRSAQDLLRRAAERTGP